MRLLHRWFWLSRGMTLGVRAAAFDAAGRVFLVRHAYLPGWHLPGGGVEHGQTLEEALSRELLEEGNLVLSRPAQLFGVYYNPLASDRDHVALFVARDVRQTAPRLPDKEIAEAGFFALDELPVGVTHSTLARLREIAEGAHPSPRW